MLCGVGGQGTILAADLLAKVAAAAGLDVKLSEVHGMSQRGGSVDTVVKFGERGLLAGHRSRRWSTISSRSRSSRRCARVHYVKPEGRLLVNPTPIRPLPVLTGELPVPHGLRGDARRGGRDLHRRRRARVRGRQPEVGERRADGRAVDRAAVRRGAVARGHQRRACRPRRSRRTCVRSNWDGRRVERGECAP